MKEENAWKVAKKAKTRGKGVQGVKVVKETSEGSER
jgi:hypothetical protein